MQFISLKFQIDFVRRLTAIILKQPLRGAVDKGKKHLKQLLKIRQNSSKIPLKELIFNNDAWF